jgi:large subunit ribosomal protein L37e
VYTCVLIFFSPLIILGAGLGFGFPGLTLGFGVGAGCGVGIGFGYGMGKGIAYDEHKRYSNVGKMFQEAPHLPT